MAIRNRIGPLNRFSSTVDRWAQLTLLSRADQSGAQSSKPMPMAAMHLSVRVQAVALHRQRTEHARVVREAAASGNGLKWDWLSGNACARGWAVAGGTSLRWATCLWSHSSDTCTRRPNPIQFNSLSAVNSPIGIFPLDRFRNIPIRNIGMHRCISRNRPECCARRHDRRRQCA